MAHQNFEKYAEEKCFNYSVPKKFQKIFNTYLLNLGRDPSSVKILDFGCGDGKHYQFFINRGLLPENIYGVDISKKRIGRCKNIGWEKSFLVKNESLPFADDFFDLISMSEVVEHIPEKKIKNVFSELSRIIKGKGFLIITTPNYPMKRFYDFVDVFWNQKWNRLKDDPTHVNFYNSKKLKNFLSGYFNSVKILPYKNGFIYEKFKKDFFLHKVIAVCSHKK